jgi:hypothetical protein
MTLHDEPPIVDLDEILDERETDASRITGGQWALVIGGGVIGIAGLLSLLVVIAPVVVELVQALHTISQVGSVTP